MPNTEVIILFARQHSGTDTLLPILETHPQIFCLNDVFNIAHKDSSEPLLRETNFFNFVSSYASRDISKILPDNHENLFLDYLEYLKCFSNKRYLLLRVTYDTAHFFTKPFSDNVTTPYLFNLICTHNLKVFNLTRRNHLQYALAYFSKTGAEKGNGSLATAGRRKLVKLDINPLLKELERCKAEDELFAKYFASYQHYLTCDYVDIFATKPMNRFPAFLQQFSNWLGIKNDFYKTVDAQSEMYLPLKEVVENFSEVEDFLRGTRFEYLLEFDRACSEFKINKWKNPLRKIPNKIYQSVLAADMYHVVELGTALGVSAALIN